MVLAVRALCEIAGQSRQIAPLPRELLDGQLKNLYQLLGNSIGGLMKGFAPLQNWLDLRVEPNLIALFVLYIEHWQHCGLASQCQQRRAFGKPRVAPKQRHPGFFTEPCWQISKSEYAGIALA